ncbi:hypothetical protein PC9H_003537 [Pleurotus ostreatus]|uniref:Transcription factor n=2 Tax=Pleurotus TaxID=5320 RepID=A0A8H7A124_PLEOS|nr:uncharacterized protein PC9H_003537 [Pleurotus ostreatus]KAF7436704.1 hypothetical protein PC9H_003537 [Pleurotus ostreatus]KAG9222699.1 hypothetical protein CCMSSC00406_0004613 [Pleurotus cornucopiae]
MDGSFDVRDYIDAPHQMPAPINSDQSPKPPDHPPSHSNSRSATPTNAAPPNITPPPPEAPQTDAPPPAAPSPAAPPAASPDPGASIQSLLASKKDAASNGPPAPPAWSPQQPLHAPMNGLPAPLAPGKRKLDDKDTEDPHHKIRRIVGDHVSQDPSRVMPMTTVICLHAAVAQKSYGSEKRFLCPPPVVHIEGPVWHLRSQQLSMSVVSENGERSFEQKAPLDNNMTASFKFLHVTGTAKAKSFQLSLDVAEPAPNATGSESNALPGRVWASFDSAPVTIISKPSKKTAKTRNISSCILAGGPVSLFNRINSQTVRTKYMTIDHAQLCASNVAWSAFNVNVVRRPDQANLIGAPLPVTYGCEIVLSDTHSGIATSPLIIRKVDKGRVSPDDGGPVSQMQKIALQRVNPDGSRHYLSAAGPIPVPGTPGVIPPPAPGISSHPGTHPLLFQSPRVREELKDGVRIISDEVDDYLCWTIVGISKFQYTFFDAFGQNQTIPEMPITPFPTLFTAPVYRPANNAVELTVSNFFYEDPKTHVQTPLDVYLGNLGPLRHRVYQAATPGPLTNIAPFGQPLVGGPPPPDGSNPAAGDHAMMAGPSGAGMSPPRFVPTGPLHTIVIVEMPPLADVIKALEEDALPPNHDPSRPPSNGEGSQPREGSNGASPPHPSITGRSLPLLFIRAYDGVGYHSGRTIACENVFQSMDLSAVQNPANPLPGGIEPGWLAAAQAAAAAEGGLHGWTLRVM